MAAPSDRVSYCKKLFKLAIVQALTTCDCPEHADDYTKKMTTLACEISLKSVEMFSVEGGGYGPHERVASEAMLTFAQHLSSLTSEIWRADKMTIDLHCQEINRLAGELLKYERKHAQTTMVAAPSGWENCHEPNQSMESATPGGENSNQLVKGGRTRRKRKWWVQPTFQKRAKCGEFSVIAEMRLTDHQNHFEQLRMTPERFDELLQLVGPEIVKAHTSFRQPISPGEQLALTLRYLAHGESQQQLSTAFRLGKSTVCLILRRTLIGMWNVLSTNYMPPPNEEDWAKLEEDFTQKWNFPNCVGAIDGRHVAMHAPNNTGQDTRGLLVMVACDANHKFTLMETGASGRSVDRAIVFWESTFGKALLENNISLPASKELPGTMVKTPHVFVASDSFPPSHSLMRPFAEQSATVEQLIYNFRLSRVQRVTENAFGVLASKWRIFRQPIVANSFTVENIIKATIGLHNYLKTNDRGERNANHMYCPPGYVDAETEDGIVGGQWRQLVTSTDAIDGIGQLGRKTSSEGSEKTRDAFVDYFNSPCGELEWQYSYVMRNADLEVMVEAHDEN